MPVEDHGPGVIIIPCGNVGRYREFDMSLAGLIKPRGTNVDYRMSTNIASSINRAIKMMNDDDEWVWILNDDHTFKPNLLVNLLDRNVDVVVPLCCTRQQPFIPVILDLPENEYRHMGWQFLEGKSGCILATDVSLGGAGMLIRRNVLEIIPQPWFEVGKAGNPEVLSEDTFFYTKLRQYGISYYLDLDNYLGHITHAVVMPTKTEKGDWCVTVQTP